MLNFTTRRSNSRPSGGNLLISVIMGNKALRIFYVAIMALAIIALVAFMIVHIRAGLETTNAKLLLGAYVLMIIWAAMRLIRGIKNLRDR